MDESSKTKPLTSNRNRIRLPYEPGDFVVPREKLLLTPESEHEEYEAGDLIWVKIHGYPWWPCMVTVDPLTGKYIKRETMSDGEQQVEYHVQYFGPKAYRSYTAGQILDYEGKEKYETHLDNLKNTPVSDRAARQKELKIYSIKPGQKRNWTVAATKADEAMSLTREQRIQQLTFEYELVNRYGAKIKSELRTTSSKKPRSRSLSTASKERPAQTSASNSPIVHSRVNEPQTMPVKRGRGRPRGSVGVKRKSSNFTGDVYDFNEFDDELNESTPTKPLLLFSAKRANRGEFTVFANRHRDQIVQENPKLDEQQVTDLLQNKWDLLADDQRNLYVNRAGASLSATGTASSPKLASALEFSDADESASPETPTIVKRKRGRPRRSDKPVVLSSTKRKLSTESDEIALKKPRTIQAQSPNENGSSVKRPRGRPRKSIVVMPNKSDDSPTENSIVKTPPRQSTRSRRRSAVVLDSSFSENQSNILNKSSKENLDENVTIESDLIDSEMEHDLKEMAQEKTNDLKEDESKEFKTEDSKDAKNEDLDGSDDDESEEIKAEISFDRESNEAPNEIENEDFNDIKDHEPIDTLVREDIKDLEDEPLDHNESSLKEDEDISTKSECDEIVSDPGKQQGFQLEMSDDEDEPEDEEDEKEVEEEDNDAPDEKKDDDDESDGNAGSPANSADPALQPESESTQKPPQEEQTDSSKASEPDPSNEENKVNESVPKLKRSYSRRKLKPSASSTELETNGSTAGNNSDAEAISESELTFGAEKGTNFCSKCFLFNNDKMIRCRGSCKRSFHSKCFGVMVEDSTELTCNECKTGKFKCFVCNEHSADVRNCTAYQCPKYYHLDCVKKNYPIRLVKQQQDFRCPLHFCLTCYGQHQDDNVFRCVKKRMFTCIRCPTAYHRMSSCLAAGSVVISNQHIICPEHVKEAKSRHINVSWCFSCNMGGDLVCCERCPNAFHADCLEYKLPDGNFICSSCTKRKQLLYNDVVWVKLGNFRWWPGLIKHPSTVPLNIQNMKHQNGDFPVFFFGSHDYFWVNRGRVFLYMEGDENRRFSCRRMMDKIFKLAMEEAIAQFKLWKQAKQTDLSRKSIKPPPYHYIKVRILFITIKGNCDKSFL